MACYGQVRAFGQELPQQTVGVLVTPALPGRMRICEPDIHIQPIHQFCVARHLATAVIGHAGAHLRWELLQLSAEAFQRSFSRPAARMSVDAGVDAGVDGLVADALCGIVGMHVTQLGSNLLRRPAVQHQVVADTLEQGATLDNLALAYAAPATLPIALGCQRGSVSGPFLSPQLARQRGRASAESLGNGANACPVAYLDLEQCALLRA